MSAESQVFAGPFAFYDLPAVGVSTYSAYLKVDIAELGLTSGMCIAVRGPYPTVELATISLKINKLKMQVGATSLLPMVVCELKPDLFPQYRRLCKVEPSNSYYFVLSTDLASAMGQRPLMREERCRGFSDGCDRVDWNSLAKLGLHRGLPKAEAYVDSLFRWDPFAGQQLLYHVMMNWIFGVTKAGFARENFIYREPGLVYNINVDCLGHPMLKLYKQPICSPHFKLFFQSQELEFLRQKLIECQLSLLPADFYQQAIARSRLSPPLIHGALVGPTMRSLALYDSEN